MLEPDGSGQEPSRGGEDVCTPRVGIGDDSRNGSSSSGQRRSRLYREAALQIEGVAFYSAEGRYVSDGVTKLYQQVSGAT